ncbi:hypothetical protein [Curtobacterium sp. 9128]|uniref:hypothetical protein n=1 Tax=Curtobacterium sp. 9128 TaxID=1793722 RepID=UPI0011A072AB|nr:hypothetical protein [Curtobacterium sp. 9128]
MSDVEDTRAGGPREAGPRGSDLPGSDLPGSDLPGAGLPAAGALAAIETAVLAVPGVAELYRAMPTIESAIASIRGVRGTEPTPRIVVDDGELRVVIGTDGVVPAPRVARAVHDAAVAEADRHALALTRIDVRVARVG